MPLPKIKEILYTHTHTHTQKIIRYLGKEWVTIVRTYWTCGAHRVKYNKAWDLALG
jgi:hypothetical protein